MAAGHWPIEATLPVVPFSRRGEPVSAPTAARYDKVALLHSVHADTPQAVALKEEVAQALQAVTATELHQVRESVNRILLDAVERRFPLGRSVDTRVSAQGSFRASAKRTWQLYRELKVHRAVTPHAVFRQWRAAAAFLKASKALRTQSRHLKQTAILEKLEEAEAAACKGDQRTLHQIVRSLTPNKRQFMSRLRDTQGHLLDKPASLQAMLQYARDTFSIYPDTPTGACIQQGVSISDQQVQATLQKLGAAKAVPYNTAPAAIWKLCAGSIASLLGRALRLHFQAGSTSKLRADLHDAYITLIPKPNKPGTEVANLRPIGLQCPSAKTIASLIRQNLLDVLLPLVRDLPQYAYAKSRGTFDAILRVHMHFEEVQQCLRENRTSRIQQHQGKKPLGCVGGLGLSLDLSKAYDFASRPIIYETLAKHGVSQDTIAVIQQLHTDAQYVFRAGANVGRHTTTNGLKQGCCIAPFLWSFFTVAVMHSLRDKLGQEWLHQALVLFADDHWCQWVIKSKADFERSVQQLQVVLETLMDFRMSINFKKTAILCRLEGKQAKSVLRDHIKLRNGDKFFSVQVRGQEQLIPIRAVHEHLGTKVTYHHRLDANMEHRIHSGQAKYQALRKTLNGHHTLQVQHRLRLWAACVQTSMHYSLAAVGVTRAGLDKLTKLTTKHLRAIQRQPVHLTHTTNEQVLQSANLLPPGQVLLRSLQRFRESLNFKAATAPDITTRADVCAYVERLEASWRHLINLQQHQDAQLPIIAAAVPCPYCDACFTTENAMRIHAQLAHQNLPPRAACNPTKFVPRQHATGGLPVCRLCLRSFFKWQNLREHIESGACEKLGGESMTKHPVKPDDTPAPTPQDLVAETPPDDATGTQQNVPLLERSRFAKQSQNWESLLRDPTLQPDLQSHCTLCHMWIASFRHVKQHICKMHEPETPGLHAKATALCLSFKQHLVRDHKCPWCKRKVWAPARHAQQCVVLYQICVARVRFEQSQDDGCDARAQPRSRHLRFLQPQSAHQSHVAACPVKEGGKGGGEAGTGGLDSATQEAPTRAEPTLQCQASARIPTSTTSAASQHPALGGGQIVSQGSAASRGPACGAKDGQGLRSFHAPGLREHHTEPARHLDGVARQEGGGARGPHLLPTDGSPCLLGEGIARQGSKNGVHNRGPGEAPGSALAGSEPSLDLSSLVPQISETSPGQQQGEPQPHRTGEAAHLLARESPRRHHPQVPQHQRPGSGRGKHLQPSIRDLLVGHLPQRGESGRDARGPVQAVGLLHVAAHRGIDEAGRASTIANGKTPCKTAVWEVTASASSSTAPATEVRAPAVVDSAPAFSLTNPGNHCYANAFMYSLSIAARCAAAEHLMPSVLTSLRGKHHVQILRHLGFLTLGWRLPEQQHDVSEFIDFLHPKLMPRSLQGSWQGRRVLDGSMQITEETPLTQCIGLGAPPKHSPILQHLINHWCAQEYRQALVRTTPWLFLQLPRFRHHQSNITKAKQSYTLPASLQVPVFCAPAAMEVQWQTYQVAAVICHKGPTPSSGHYYVVTKSEGGYLALDDDKKPSTLDADALKRVSREMYVVVLAIPSRSRHNSEHASNTNHADCISLDTGANHGLPLAEIRRPSWRGMDCEPDLSAGGATQTDGSRHGHPAAEAQLLADADLSSHEKSTSSVPATCAEKLTQQVPEHADDDRSG